MFLARSLSHVPALVNCLPRRAFHAAPALFKDHVPVRPKTVVEADIEESFLRGTGPGGQKINKTSSAVQLKHLPTGIVVKVQDSRSRDLNRILARKKLAEQLDLAANGEESWIRKKAGAEGKKRAKKHQKSRAKYRKLDEEKSKQRALSQQPTSPADATTGAASGSGAEAAS